MGGDGHHFKRVVQEGFFWGDDLPAEHKNMRNSQEKNQGKVFQSKGSDYTKKAKLFKGQNGQFYWDGMIINFMY